MGIEIRGRLRGDCWGVRGRGEGVGGGLLGVAPRCRGWR